MENEYEKKYTLGLDVGISSVGWAVVELDDDKNPKKIIDAGSRIFSPGEVDKTGESKAKIRRQFRGSKRLLRRRGYRIDSVKYLLNKYNIIPIDLTGSLRSDGANALSKEYDNLIKMYYRENKTNPYELKVEALDRKLLPIELGIILVHYAKHRGYKSNREETSSNENGKVLSAISENTELLKKYRIISEMLIKDEKFVNRIRNTNGDYKLSFNNSSYEDEINKVLDKQVEFGLINNEFKTEYMEIWSSRRNYSSGPGFYFDKDKKWVQSPYGGNLIEKMVGTCEFDGNPRAPKMAASSEVFVALTKLLNLRYKSEDNKYVSLTTDDVKTIIDLLKNKKEVKYKDVVSVLNKENVSFKDVELTKKDYGKVCNEFKKQNNLDIDKKIVISELSEEKQNEFKEMLNKKLLSIVFIKMDGYSALKKLITDAFGVDEWNIVKDNYEMLDELAKFCTNYKLNEDLTKAILDSEIIDNKYADYSFVENLPTNFKDHLNLSSEIIREIIPLMEKGIRYDEAMESLFGTHNDLNSVCEKKDLLIPILNNKNITNQRVVRSLSQTRKVINAVIKKYGSPYSINIETARELAKSREERNKIENNNKQRQIENDQYKKEILAIKRDNHISGNNVTGQDLLKYRLWKEQEELCAYSREHISVEQLFDNNYVQVDHILPYSRTFDDSYFNKTLVLTRYNQNKGNRIPHEWMSSEEWSCFSTFISNLNIPVQKKENYLLDSLTPEIASEMQNQNLNDTKYISRELMSFIKAYLNVDEVNVYQGAMTAKLRGIWGFNRMIHSYVSPTYYMPSDYMEGVNKDRENHLHHALDAIVIAVSNKSLQKKITLYEKYNRFINGKTYDQLKNYTELDNSMYVDNKTGEVFELEDLKSYIREEMSKKYINFTKRVAKLEFPVPYENFIDEAKIRVYEQNLDVMKYKLSEIKTYSKDDLNNVHVLVPSFAKNKISGSMHEDTYYGIVKDKETNQITYKTIRKPLEKISKKDIEAIEEYESNNGNTSGSKDILSAVKKWMLGCENGAEALKKNNNQYPFSESDIEKKPIRKLKVYEKYNNNGHVVRGTSVETSSVQYIEVYKSKDNNDNKLYFVAYDMFDYSKLKRIEKGYNEDFDIRLFYAQQNCKIVSFQNVGNGFERIIGFRKNDFVKIINNNDKCSIAYVVGFSNGRLEVKSPLGDGNDLIGDDKLFNNITDRYFITVSTIKSIEKLSIDVLGEISGI